MGLFKSSLEKAEEAFSSKNYDEAIKRAQKAQDQLYGEDYERAVIIADISTMLSQKSTTHEKVVALNSLCDLWSTARSTNSLEKLGAIEAHMPKDVLDRIVLWDARKLAQKQGGLRAVALLDERKQDSLESYLVRAEAYTSMKNTDGTIGSLDAAISKINGDISKVESLYKWAKNIIASPTVESGSFEAILEKYYHDYPVPDLRLLKTITEKTKKVVPAGEYANSLDRTFESRVVEYINNAIKYLAPAIKENNTAGIFTKSKEVLENIAGAYEREKLPLRIADGVIQIGKVFADSYNVICKVQNDAAKELLRSFNLNTVAGLGISKDVSGALAFNPTYVTQEFIEKEVNIDIRDSVINRSTIGAGEAGTNTGIEDAVVSRSKITPQK